MRRVWLLTLAFIVVAICFPVVNADRGLIPVPPEVSVYEPGQKAILAWNGQEEIMILSTDVTSNQEALVLELLPLPSQPDVEAASFQSFEEIQTLIWEEGISLHDGWSQEGARSGSVEILFHEEIGAHDITVVKATDAAELVDWMQNFLQANNVTETISLGDFEPAVENYMGRGFRYYALDLITVGLDKNSVDPILYRFQSTYLYYPLVITSPVEGETEITLFLLTEGKVEEDYEPMLKVNYQIPGESPTPIEILLSKGDVSKIDLRIGELFDDGAWLTVLKYEGHLSWLTRDLMISKEAINPATTVDVEVILSYTLIVSCILLGAVCTLAGVVVGLLIMRSMKGLAKIG